MRSRLGPPTLATIFGLFGTVALHAFTTTGPQAAGDTVAYLRMADLPVLSGDFLFGERSVVYPLFLKAVGKDLAVAGHLQTLLCVCCWGFLAWASLRLLSTPAGRVLGFALVLLCALREEVLFWNGVAMSESLSLSLFALWLASWIMFARGAASFWRLLPLPVSLLFAFVRDSNAFLVFGAAVLLAAVFAARRGPLHLLLAIALVAFFAGSLACRVNSIRPEYSLQNIVSGRVVGDERIFARFGAVGMPTDLSPFAKKYLAGKCGDLFVAFGRSLYTLGHPEVRDLFLWLREDGQRGYRAFLARNPGYFLTRPFVEDGALRFAFPLAAWVGPSGCDPPLLAEVPRGFGTLLPEAARRLRRGDSPGWYLLIWALTAAACGAAWALHRPFRAPLLWDLLLLAAAVPHLLVVWHGDALSVPRHAVLVGVQAHLALAFALALSVDALLAVGGARRRRPAAAATLLPWSSAGSANPNPPEPGS